MSGPNGDPNMSMEEGLLDDEDDFGDEEYVAINSMLDQINSYLDDLEERNDSLNGKLHELMESNRQARLEFRAQLVGAQNREEEEKDEEEHHVAESPAGKEEQDRGEGDQLQKRDTDKETAGTEELKC